ncbi:G-type lectin S-receptor-like serine/threonine-protein kinase [Pyrus ussuriensis x Pyrus communis]|uniref:G-type lectin S-receptor-like serine/threonine-protein kinase n=1 Tax=Pyrus ussuriensis x Pyrus communis TaxID=2448454 RepID=A0A5N5G8T2_9ROSA|nr:G-type lectin S-receptor-like serine/threonine-protein kinase [Pyrus ussuriensis x Pyrus communis]
MNPKISDFGLARSVEGTQNLENTQRVVGTRGYMSPEYAMGGIFSQKSDVYSFGVLVLEIISGKKNSAFYIYDQQLVMKCVHIGLLCVQDNPTDRPSMPDVIFMLNGSTNRCIYFNLSLDIKRGFNLSLKSKNTKAHDFLKKSLCKCKKRSLSSMKIKL